MWPISNTQTFINYFENHGLEQAPCGIPTCTQAIAPLNLSDDIPLDISLEWESTPGAIGYLLYFGTDNPPTSIENGLDLGDITAYTPSGILNHETDYYWKVLPYNFGGNASSCQVFQFTTIDHPISLNLKLYLEGPFSSSQMTPDLNTSGYIPLEQPYNTSPWNYPGTESVVSIPVGAIDWVLIDILKPHNTVDGQKFELLNQIAGFLMYNGEIRDLNGLNNLSVALDDPTFHVRIQHRNHLPIVSSVPLSGFNQIFIYDFSTASTKALGGLLVQKELEPGTWAMIAANGNANLQIDNTDKNDVWLLQQGMKGYYNGDFNMDSDVNVADKAIPWESNIGRGAYPVQDTMPAK